MKKNMEKLITRWFKVTFSSPRWRSLNPFKGSLKHPKKVTLNHEVPINWCRISSINSIIAEDVAFQVEHPWLEE